MWRISRRRGKNGGIASHKADTKPTKNNTMLEIAGADYALYSDKLQIYVSSWPS
jgi:hypothetical protein